MDATPAAAVDVDIGPVMGDAASWTRDVMPNPPESAAQPDPLIGQVLAGRYLVRELIDRGGMGKVYRAEQQPLGRMVALKTLDLHDPRGEFRDRFFNEASVASKLTHPNTVRVFDYGRSDDGVYFLTMELLEGQPLQRVVKSEAPLDPLRLIPIMRQVCGALHEAHEAGVVHRDMKPGNIFLTRHGDDLEFAKVLDFGLVKDLGSDVNLSQTGQSLGSPLYMAPEQVEGDPVDRRTDIYAIGLVMYVALTGRVPFKKGSVARIMMQQVTGTIPTFDEIAPGHGLPASLEWVVRRCIEKRPADRMASMRDLSRALKQVERELRGELSGPAQLSLGSDGALQLAEGPGGLADEPPPQPPRPMTAPLPDIPSSPTLNRSTTTVAAAGLVGGGLFVGGFALLGGVVIVALVAVGAIYWTQTTEPPPPAPTPAPVPTEVVPATPPAPAAVEVEVELVTEPDGAEVLRDGRLIGTAPVTLSIDGEPVELTITAPGHDPRDVLVDGSVRTLRVPLRPTPRPVRAPPPDPAPAAPGPAPQVERTREGSPRQGSPDITEIRDPWEDP